VRTVLIPPTSETLVSIVLLAFVLAIVSSLKDAICNSSNDAKLP
jgi:hypothetical protein